MRKNSVRLAALLLVAAGPPVLSPVAANATEADCPAGNVCVWNQANFTGEMASTAKPMAGCIPGVSASAVNGTTDLKVLFWSTTTCTGESSVLAPGDKADTIVPAASSVMVVPVEKCLVEKLLCF